MSAAVGLLVLLGPLVAGVTVVWAVHRRRVERNVRRAAALTSVAERIDSAVMSLREVPVPAPVEAISSTRNTPAPAVADGLPGRAALLDELATGVERSRADGSRLAAAVVRSVEQDAGALARDVREIAGVPAYAVGTRSVALVLRGLGRADTLGLLAKIEAHCASTGRAVVLEPGETAVDLVARLLGPGAGP
ncbi:MAG TPA: hypothetical protein VHH57_12340 [Gaiella sp.]|nr:hypothetical protein [Gaiella sp.]